MLNRNSFSVNDIPRQLVYDYVCEHLDKTDNVKFTMDDVYIVISCFILGNRKYLVSTNLPDGMYYEVTYNRTCEEWYLDAYKKFENRTYRNKDLMKKNEESDL